MTVCLFLYKCKKNTLANASKIETIKELRDPIDSNFEAILSRNYNINYYNYNLKTINNNTTNVEEMLNVINYFLKLPYLKYHDQVIFLFTNKIKHNIKSKIFSVLLQRILIKCLEEIITSSSNVKNRLLWVFPIFIKFNRKQVERFCLSNILKLIHLKHNEISYPNSTIQSIVSNENLSENIAYTDFNASVNHSFNLLLLFHLKVLTVMKYQKTKVLKSLLIIYKDPSILHISLNFC